MAPWRIMGTMRLPIGRRSVFFAWLLSYGILLGLLLVMSLVVDLQASRALIRQIDKVRTTTLRQAADAIGSRLEDLERLDLAISWNSRLMSFSYIEDPLHPADHYPLTLLQRDFLVYMFAYPFVREFYVYFHNSDLVLSSQTACGSELFHECYVKRDVPSYRDWISLMKGDSGRRFVVVGDSIAYVKSLPAERFLPVNATLAILVDRNWLTGILSTLAWDDQESIVILDRDNRIVARAGDGAIPVGLRFEDMDDPKTLRAYQDKGLLLASVSLPVSGWKAVSVLPEKAFMRPVTSLQTFTILSLLACLAAGGLMAFRFAKGNFERISEVAREMADLAGIRVDGGNEYAMLRDAVSATLSWKAKIDSDRRQNNAALRQIFLRRLLRGRFESAEEVQQSLAEYSIALLSPYLAVFIVHPEGLPDHAAHSLETGRRLASFIMGSAVEDILGKVHRGFVTEHDDMLVCIVSLRFLSALEWNRDLDAMIAETRKYLADSFGLRTTVGLSGVGSGIESLPQSFQEAQDALEYKLVVGSGTVIRYGDVRNRKSLYRCPLEIEHQLHNAVRIGDEARAEEILAQIVEKNFHEGEPSIQGLKCFLFDMINLLSLAVSNAEEPRQRDLSEIIQPLMRLKTADTTLPALEQEVRRAVLAMCRSLRDVRKDNHLAFEIREFVQGAYADLNLSIGLIADRFRMGQGYISRLFREMTGEGLLDYIAEVRIAHAKALMDRGGTSLQDVATAVGYTSANALIRAFKKHEGVTPGKYREAGVKGGS